MWANRESSSCRFRCHEHFAPARTAILWTGIVLGVLVAALLLTVALVDWNSLRQPLERFASERSGRKISIADLDVDIWSWTPKVTVKGLTIGNPPWEPAKPMVQVERVHAQLKLLALLKADLILPAGRADSPDGCICIGTAPGRANWTFESQKPTNAPSGEPPDLPGDSRLSHSGRHAHRSADDIAAPRGRGHDPARGEILGERSGGISDSGSGPAQRAALRDAHRGRAARNLDPDRPYPFNLAISAGDIRIKSKGSVRKPFDLSR